MKTPLRPVLAALVVLIFAQVLFDMVTGWVWPDQVVRVPAPRPEWVTWTGRATDLAGLALAATVGVLLASR